MKTSTRQVDGVTIVDLSGDEGRWHVIREGAIPRQQIADLLGDE